MSSTQGNSSDPEIPVMDPRVINDLRQLVASYHEVDNQIKQLRNTMCQRRKVKAELSTRICEIMHAMGLSDIKYSNSMLRFTTRKVTLPATRATIKERLQSLFPEGSDRHQHALQLVLAPRAVEERVSIRKVRVR